MSANYNYSSVPATNGDPAVPPPSYPQSTPTFHSGEAPTYTYTFQASANGSPAAAGAPNNNASNLSNSYYPNPPTNYPPPPQFSEYPAVGEKTQFPVIATQPGSQPNTVIIVQQQHLGRFPCTAYCVHCQKNVVTRCTKEAGTSTYLAAGLCCLFCWPCTCLPFFIDDLKDVEHRCPECNILVGVTK